MIFVFIAKAKRSSTILGIVTFMSLTPATGSEIEEQLDNA